MEQTAKARAAGICFGVPVAMAMVCRIQA